MSRMQKQRNDTGVSPQTFSCTSTSNQCVQDWSRRGRRGFLFITLSLAILVAVAAVQLACGGYSAGSSSSPNPAPTPAPATFPSFSHVFLVVEENHSFTDVIGNSSMPYLNSLASKY